MKRRFVFCFSVQLLAAAILYSLFSAAAGAGMSQLAGMPDVVIDNRESVCRGCHGNAEQFSAPMPDTTVGDRHHVLYGTPVGPGSAAPYPAAGESFDCATCHNVSGLSGGTLQVEPLRDCTLCHGQGDVGGLVHHLTDLAQGTLSQGPDCQACHGSFVDNINDGHYMPLYEASMVTPAPGINFNPNHGMNGEGSCDFCHVPDVEAGGIASNYATHHDGTGFGADEAKCLWCHRNNPPDTSDPNEMRACENCHGVQSLHNIQLDSNGNGVIAPGTEAPGSGHVGNNSDCTGCHGRITTASMVLFPMSSIPTVHGLTMSVLTAGEETAITLTGNGFRPVFPTNDPLQPYQEYPAGAELAGALIQPDALTDGSMTFTVPGNLDIGNYGLRALRVTLKSNLVGITVKPKVMISSVTGKKGKIIISGSGFGPRPQGMDAYLNADVNGSRLTVTSWTENEIEAAGSLPTNYILTVNGVFGSAVYVKGGATAGEICGDALDNDGDGKIDCSDRDCRKAPECR